MTVETDYSKDDREDQRLVLKVRSGSRAAFDRIVRKYQRRLYFTVRKLVKDHQSTDDILQDVFVKAYLNLEQYDISRPFFPWLHRIAVNSALNELGHRTRRRENSLESEDGTIISLQDPDPGPGEKAEEADLQGALSRALEQLPEDQRLVFLLRASEGLSYEEIAEHMGITSGTVMSRLSRAREKLRRLLRPYLGDQTQRG